MTDSGVNLPTSEGIDTNVETIVISPVLSSAAVSMSVAFFYKGDENTIDIS